MPPQENSSGNNPPGTPNNSGAPSGDPAMRSGEVISPMPQQTPSNSSVIQPTVYNPQQPTDASITQPNATSQPLIGNEAVASQPVITTPQETQVDTYTQTQTSEISGNNLSSQLEAQPSPQNTETLLPTGEPAAPAAPPLTPAKPKKRINLKALLLVTVLVITYLGSAAAAYYLGTKSKSNDVAQLAVKANSIQLPKEAIVTAECTPGRGKQYIIPKDIPVGPIYDVKDGNVIAIEYLISLSSLLLQADTFTDKITELTKAYTVDHFKLVPTPARAGENEQYVHLIMFIVPKSVSESITCDGTPSTTGTNPSDMTDMSQPQ